MRRGLLLNKNLVWWIIFGSLVGAVGLTIQRVFVLSVQIWIFAPHLLSWKVVEGFFYSFKALDVIIGGLLGGISAAAITLRRTRRDKEREVGFLCIVGGGVVAVPQFVWDVWVIFFDTAWTKTLSPSPQWRIMHGVVVFTSASLIWGIVLTVCGLRLIQIRRKAQLSP